MPKYHVHVYPIVRVLVPNVEAENQEEACKKAELIMGESVDRNEGMLRAEYSDDIDGFLVDEDGDLGHELSVWYDNKYRPL
mgnify:CR=1 FL=1